MFIAFHNTAAGVGSTTLAEHACTLARELGLAVALVAGGLRSHDELDVPVLEREAISRPHPFDLLIADIRPWEEPAIEPDVWVVPMCDAVSQARACELSDRLQGGLIWIGNRGYRVEDAPTYLSAVVAPSVPYSRAIGWARDYRRVVWSDPTLAGSAGAKALRQKLKDVLELAFIMAGTSLSTAIGVARLRHVERDTASAKAAMQASHLELDAAIKQLMATVAEARPPSATPESRRIVDPGLAALIQRVQATLASKPSPFTFGSGETGLASGFGRQTFGVWLDALHRGGGELACGCKTPRQFADLLRPRKQVAESAMVCAETVARFNDIPGRTLMRTLVQIVVAMDRVDTLDIQLREQGSDEPAERSPQVVTH